MGRTEQRGERADAPDGVSALGTIVAAVSMVGLLVPVRRGVDEPVLRVAAVLAVVAVASFIAHRHGLLEKRFSSLFAAASSVLVSILAAASVMLGTTGSVVLPELGWSVSLIFLSFLSSATAVGVAIAAYGGVTVSGLGRRTSHFLEMVVLGYLGLFAIEIASLFVALPVLTIGGELTELQWQVVRYVSFGLGIGGVAIGYLFVRDYGLSYLDLEIPSLSTILWIILGLVFIFGANITISVLMSSAGIESAGHSTAEAVEQNLDLLAVVMPAMFLIVGPAEELLYRNVIQKSLYGTFSRYGAVVVASVIFSVVHISAYATAGAGQILASLAGVFALSIVLGVLYERTEDLLVPSIVHGSYNTLLFVPLLV